MVDAKRNVHLFFQIQKRLFCRLKWVCNANSREIFLPLPHIHIVCHNTDNPDPLDNGDITIEEAYKAAETPIRDFMYGQTQEKDLHLFMDIDGEDYPDQMTLELYYDVPMTTVIPAFIISELRYAFIMGFLIYIPFIVIDMVVASVLMSMGMMMLPPTTISLPFKILLFILADGWNLVIGSVVKTFY